MCMSLGIVEQKGHGETGPFRTENGTGMAMLNHDLKMELANFGESRERLSNYQGIGAHYCK